MIESSTHPSTSPWARLVSTCLDTATRIRTSRHVKSTAHATHATPTTAAATIVIT